MPFSQHPGKQTHYTRLVWLLYHYNSKGSPFHKIIFSPTCTSPDAAVNSNDWSVALYLLARTCKWVMFLAKPFSEKQLTSERFSLWLFWHHRAVQYICYRPGNRRQTDILAHSSCCLVLHDISSLTRAEKTRGFKGHVIISYMHMFVRVQLLSHSTRTSPLHYLFMWFIYMFIFF